IKVGQQPYRVIQPLQLGEVGICTAHYIFSLGLCQKEPSVTANFTAANTLLQTFSIMSGILNIRRAMLLAGYVDQDYTILMQTYPSPIPGGPGFRYPESNGGRWVTGGCGFWDADADWANTVALATVNDGV